MLIVCGAGFVLFPGLPLLKVILLSQVANGILLPFVLGFMLILTVTGSLRLDGLRIPERPVGKLHRHSDQRDYGAADDSADLQQRHGDTSPRAPGTCTRLKK